MLFVCKGVYVSSKTRGRRGIDASDMVVDSDLVDGQAFATLSHGKGQATAYMFASISRGLFQEMNQVRRTQFAQGDE